MRALTCAIAMTLLTATGAAQAAKIERTKQEGDRGARVVSVDNLIFPAGFVGTAGDGLAQVDQVVEAAHKLLAERGLGIGAMAQHTVFVKDGAVAPGAVILGHSFGSIVSAAAVAQGLATPRLILVNPIGAPALHGPRGALTRLAILYYWLGAKLPRPVGERLLRSPVIVRVMSLAMVKTRDAALRRFVHDQHDTYFSRFADRDMLRDAFVASVSHDVREFAPRITVPTLLIAAQRDDITPIEKERELATMFPDATLVEIPEVGHLIHYETPQVAAAAIRTFLPG